MNHRKMLRGHNKFSTQSLPACCTLSKQHSVDAVWTQLNSSEIVNGHFTQNAENKTSEKEVLETSEEINHAIKFQYLAPA